MSSYVGHYAELYDEIYADKPYSREIDFICKQIDLYGKKPVRNILELACGTANHALLLEHKGFNVTATDYSDSMLVIAKSKVREARSSVEVRKIDMRKISGFRNKFDAIICFFDSIGYVLTNESVKKVLNGINNNLKSGGLFAFEFWHAPAMLKHSDPLRKRIFHLSNNHILHRISRTSIDYRSDIASVAYTLDEYDGKKRLYHIEETQQNRFFTIPEMELFLNVTGLKPVRFYSGYSTKELISDSSFHILCLAQKQHI